MTFLPIVARELRVASRLRGTYWSRFAAAILGAGLAAEFLSVSRQQPVAVMGNVLFKTLAGVLFIYTAVAGIGMTSDCLSEEKREGTLGLLFLTDLKGYDVVFGKLAASSINAFYGMMAVVPVLAISVLLGGVTKGEFWRVVLVAVNLLFFFLSAGLFASAVCRRENRALALAILIVAVLLGAFPFYAGLKGENKANYDFIPTLLPCPAFGCFAAFDSLSSSVKPFYFWANVLITQLYGWTFLLLSCWLVPRSWQEGARRRLPLPAAVEAWRSRPQKHLLSANPYLWRAGHGRVKYLKPWLTVGLLNLLWLWTSWRFPFQRYDPANDLFYLVVMSSLLKIQLAGEASGALGRDRASGALELVLTTPLSEKEIIRGQRLALWRQFAGPFTVVFLANILATVLEPSRRQQRLMHLSLGIFLFLDADALSWTSMWLAFKVQKPGRAALRALALILVLPVGLFVACAPVWLLLTRRFYPFPAMEVFTPICMGAFGVAADAGFGLYAKNRLYNRFRIAAAEQFLSKAQRSSVLKTP